MAKRRLSVAFAGGGPAGDMWHWVLMEGRAPRRKEVASGFALGLGAAKKAAAAAMAAAEKGDS